MALGIDTIKKEIQDRKKQAIISKAIRIQNRIKFHAQTSVDPVIFQPTTEFLSFVSTLIPAEKFKIFKSLFRYPLASSGVSKICFDKLSRVFDGRNPSYNYQFLKSEERDDWEWYRQVVLKEPTIWQTKGWDYFKTEINSVLVVDLKREQDKTDRYPQPYFYWLTLDRIISYETTDVEGQMKWIIFEHTEGEQTYIAVLDEFHYELYSCDKGTRTIKDLIVSNAHDIGYCPARFFWNEPLDIKEPDVKNHPLTQELANFDWFMFFHTSKKHLDLYAPYPIYSGYEADCDFENSETKEYCEGGYLKNEDDNYILNLTGGLKPCPRCGSKRLAGVGSYVEVPVPAKNSSGEEVPDMRNPIQITTIDSTSLMYNVEECERLETGIVNRVVGVDGEMMREAINEKQVAANFENQSSILNRIKKGFESAITWANITCAKSRYGKGFIAGGVNLGTEFFLMTADDLRNRYKMARDSGASESELDSLKAQIIETEYRNNETEKQRMLLLMHLEPYVHLTRSEVMELFTANLITEEELKLKLNFPTFVRKFERENLNIIDFGTSIPFTTKIDNIYKALLSYAKPQQQGQ